MFSLFSHQKVSIRSIAVPELGWRKVKDEAGIIQWINPEETMAFSVNFFDLKPDLPTLKNIDLLRQFYCRSVANAGGGILEVEKVRLKKFDAIKTLFKFPQTPSGIMYLASFTIPFANCSFVLKIQAMEGAVTGFRETIVANKMLAHSSGEEYERMWAVYPYGNSCKEGFQMNKSEAVEHDADFPDHHLTKSRVLLRRIGEEFTWERELEKLRPFDQ